MELVWVLFFFVLFFSEKKNPLLPSFQEYILDSKSRGNKELVAMISQGILWYFVTERQRCGYFLICV